MSRHHQYLSMLFGVSIIGSIILGWILFVTHQTPSYAQTASVVSIANTSTMLKGSATAGDFNGDGRDDLFVGNGDSDFGGNKNKIMLGGTQQFIDLSEGSTYFPSSLYDSYTTTLSLDKHDSSDSAVGNFNCDEYMDVVSVSDNKELIYFGSNGNPQNRKNVVVRPRDYGFTPAPGDNTSSVAVGDFNDDQCDDFVFWNGGLYVVYGHSDIEDYSTPLDMHQLIQTTINSYLNLTHTYGSLDANNDGYTDLLIDSPNANIVLWGGQNGLAMSNSIQVNLQPGQTPEVYWKTLYARTSLNNRVIGDFNGDGRDDIGAGNKIWTYMNTPQIHTLNQLQGFILPIKAGLSTSHIGRAGDFNGDGRDDILVTRTGTYDDYAIMMGNTNMTTLSNTSPIGLNDMINNLGFINPEDRPYYLSPLTPRSVYDRGHLLNGIAIVDLNGDSMDDLVLSQVGYDTVLFGSNDKIIDRHYQTYNNCNEGINCTNGRSNDNDMLDSISVVGGNFNGGYQDVAIINAQMTVGFGVPGNQSYIIYGDSSLTNNSNIDLEFGTARGYQTAGLYDFHYYAEMYNKGSNTAYNIKVRGQFPRGMKYKDQEMDMHFEPNKVLCGGISDINGEKGFECTISSLTPKERIILAIVGSPVLSTVNGEFQAQYVDMSLPFKAQFCNYTSQGTENNNRQLDDNDSDDDCNNREMDQDDEIAIYTNNFVSSIVTPTGPITADTNESNTPGMQYNTPTPSVNIAPDMQVNISIDNPNPNGYKQGDYIHFTITTTNNGNSPTSYAVLKASLHGMNKAGIGDGGQNQYGNIVWTLGNINAGTTHTYHFTGKIINTGVVVSVKTWAYNYEDLVDDADSNQSYTFVDGEQEDDQATIVVPISTNNTMMPIVLPALGSTIDNPTSSATTLSTNTNVSNIIGTTNNNTTNTLTPNTLSNTVKGMPISSSLTPTSKTATTFNLLSTNTTSPKSNLLLNTNQNITAGNQVTATTKNLTPNTANTAQKPSIFRNKLRIQMLKKAAEQSQDPTRKAKLEQYIQKISSQSTTQNTTSPKLQPTTQNKTSTSSTASKITPKTSTASKPKTSSTAIATQTKQSVYQTYSVMSKSSINSGADVTGIDQKTISYTQTR